MEFKLSQGLINKRLEIKDNSIARVIATKDLEVCFTVMDNWE